MRYKATGGWTIQEEWSQVMIETSDALDTKTGTVYRDGAYRVLVDGKPIRGKGGTVPFFGEMAWADAQRLVDDLWWERRLA